MLDAVEHSSEAELWGIRNLGSFKQGPGSDFFGGEIQTRKPWMKLDRKKCVVTLGCFHVQRSAFVFGRRNVNNKVDGIIA